MLKIKILGSGCANCKKLEAVARDAATTSGEPSWRMLAGQRPLSDPPRGPGVAAKFVEPRSAYRDAAEGSSPLAVDPP